MVKNRYKNNLQDFGSLANYWIFIQNGTLLPTGISFPNKIAIECQGRQHFEPVDFGGKGKEWAEKEFEKTLKRDKLKMEICQKNSILLLYFDGKTFKNAYTNELVDIKMLLK